MIAPSKVQIDIAYAVRMICTESERAVSLYGISFARMVPILCTIGTTNAFPMQK